MATRPTAQSEQEASHRLGEHPDYNVNNVKLPGGYPHPGRTLVGIGMLTSVDGAPCCMQAIRFYFDRESLRQCRLGKCMLRARGTQIQTPADTETVASPFAGSGNTALASSKHWGQSHTRAQLGSN